MAVKKKPSMANRWTWLSGLALLLAIVALVSAIVLANADTGRAEG